MPVPTQPYPRQRPSELTCNCAPDWATTSPTATEVVPVAEPLLSAAERVALAGFLAGYSGLTRDAYALDLRQYTTWCQTRGLQLFTARRPDIELFGRDMRARGRARATIARRLCTVSGFYRYAVEEELLEHSPAAHVRSPRLDYESHATALDRLCSWRHGGRWLTSSSRWAG